MIDLNKRIGKLTASRMIDVLSVKKDGKPTAAYEKLLEDLVAERVTDVATPHYVTPAMQWGLDNEDWAKAEYEKASGNVLIPCGTLDHFEIDGLACTPDGLVDPDGVVEFKCPTTPTYMRWVLAGEVPEEHKPQMAVQLLCTGRKFADFVAFDPRVKKGPRIFIRRWDPEPEYLEFVQDAAIKFLDKLEERFFEFVQKEAA